MCKRELLAVVFGCERFRIYLYGCKFQVESDHKPLEMISQKNLIAVPPHLQRMLLRLQEYVLYSHLQRHNDKDAGRKTHDKDAGRTSLEKYSPLTLLQGFERVV